MLAVVRASISHAMAHLEAAVRNMDGVVQATTTASQAVNLAGEHALREHTI